MEMSALLALGAMPPAAGGSGAQLHALQVKKQQLEKQLQQARQKEDQRRVQELEQKIQEIQRRIQALQREQEKDTPEEQEAAAPLEAGLGRYLDCEL